MLSKFSVKKPYTVLVGVVLAIVLGVVSFTRMTTDLLPNITLPYVLIMTTYTGANPETVEAVVTQPIEAGMATVSNIESISSVSSENYSMVILEFAQSTNMDSVSLEIRESLDQIESYWDDSVGSPMIIKMNPDMLPVAIAAVGVEGMEMADLSMYVQDSVVPELESIEGVASVTATGLLEESVNVVIRQDKIDAVNEKIFAAIDEQMKEAEEELADGRQTLEDSEKELADGRAELADGRAELADGEKELEEGREELENQQESVLNQLAETKKDLLTAKATLEAMKAGPTADIAVVEQYSKILQETTSLSGAATTYGTLYQAMIASGATDVDAKKQEINALKQSLLSSTLLAQVKSADTTGGIAALVAVLEQADWTTQEGHDKITTAVSPSPQSPLAAVAGAIGQAGAAADAALKPQVEEITGQTSPTVESLGNYVAGVKETTIKPLDAKLSEVNSGLVAVEKGELEAAIKFAGALSEISMGEAQMETAKNQLEAAQEQLQSGEEQLADAREQLEEGEKQLEDARKDAYQQANMNDILTVDTVKNLLTAQNFSMPAGYVTEEGVEFLVRVGDKPETVEELRALPLMELHMDGVPMITLGDVADVFYTDNSDAIYTNVNGSPGVMLSIQKQTGYSTGEVSDLLKERFGELMEQNDQLDILTLMDQGIYIDLVMDSIINNILFGGLLAVVILIIFLKDLRPTLVIAFSIPVSLVTAIVCMYFSGVTLNVISLSGLALGIGMLVDNSIVVIENIYRLRSGGCSMGEAAMEGAKEVSGAILASTLTTICVFLPIVFTEGITRQLFVDMGLTIAYSLLASLVIAMTVVPAMASKMLTKTKEKKEGKIFGGLVRGYERLLALSLKYKPVVFLGVLLLLGISIPAALSNGTAFMSEMDSTELSVTVELPKDSPLEDTAAVTDKVVERIMEIEDVSDVGAMVSGSTGLSMLSGGGSDNVASLYIVTGEDRKLSSDEIAALILEKTADLDAKITVETSSMDMSAMGGSGITIQVRGRDIDTLQKIAGEVAAIVESVEGTAEVSDGLAEADEELRVLVRREKAMEYGLTVAQVYSQVYARLAAANSATTLVAAEKDYSVYVTHGSDAELTRQLLRGIEISGTDEDGKKVKVPLGEIAEFEDAKSLTSINRADQTRYISVTASIAEGYNVGLVATKVEERLKDYPVPEGYRLVYSGENETINEAMEQVGLMLVLALVFMYLIMVAQFQSLLSPFIIMFTIPLAFTGGFLGLFLSGSEVSVIAMIGFVMLAGIIVNNGIVLIDYMNQLREGGMECREAVLTAGRTRLRPVLMTALTTILALSTMVFSRDMGSEMAKPMAVVTIGGLLYGTLLTLVVIPCIYEVFAGRRRKRGEEVA